MASFKQTKAKVLMRVMLMAQRLRHKGEGSKSTIKLRFEGCEVAIKEILVE